MLCARATVSRRVVFSVRRLRRDDAMCARFRANQQEDERVAASRRCCHRCWYGCCTAGAAGTGGQARQHSRAPRGGGTTNEARALVRPARIALVSVGSTADGLENQSKTNGSRALADSGGARRSSGRKTRCVCVEPLCFISGECAESFRKEERVERTTGQGEREADRYRFQRGGFH